jgi:AcrR family transcriptional regulator
MARTMREEVADFKRTSILKEAARQFYAKGYDGTRIDEIAAALGVTKPFIYYHFKNKTELLDEICVHATAISGETLEAAIAATDDPLQQLRTAVRQLAVEVVANQAGIAICFREEKYISPEARRRLEANRRRYDVLLNELLARAKKAKIISVSDVQVTTQVLTGAITWIFVWYREGGRLAPDDFANRIVELAMSMLNARK